MALPCDEIQRSIPWLLDDELDPETSREVEDHLQTCSACRAELEREGRLRLVLRRAAASIAVPVSLKHRIHDLMDRERSRQRVWARVWPIAAAALVLLSFLWRGATGGPLSELDELALRHARDLPMDVVAADVGPVQSYLAGKLSFAVKIPPLTADQHLRSAAARIIQVGNHEAVYVRYDTARGRVSMTVQPDTETAQLSGEVAPLYNLGERHVLLRRVRGYKAAEWKAAGLVFAMVTDLPEEVFPFAY